MTQQPRAALLFVLMAVLIDMMAVGVSMPVLPATDWRLGAPCHASSFLLAVAASIAAITRRADRSHSRDDP